MLQRIDFYELRDKLDDEGISIGEVAMESERAIDFLNSIELDEDLPQVKGWVMNAENSIRSVLNLIVMNVNPHVNKLVEHDNQINNSFNKFILRMENFFKSMVKTREDIVKKISIRIDDPQKSFSNEMGIREIHSFLESILKEMILKVLRYSYENYLVIEIPALFNYAKDNKMEISKVPNEVERKDIFWYYVYFSLVQISQTNISLFDINRNVDFRVSNLDDFNRLTGEALYSSRKEIPKESVDEKKMGEPKEGGYDD